MMKRTKHQIPLALTAGSALSAGTTMNAYVWFTLEVPDADKAKAITIQTMSAITGAWEDVVTLADVTNKYKGLSATEMAIIGPLEELRLKFASNVAATSKAVFHVTS